MSRSILLMLAWLIASVGLLEISRDASAQEKQKGVQVWFSTPTEAQLIRATLTIDNSKVKGHQKAEGIIIVASDGAKEVEVDVDAIEQVQFGKPDRLIFTDKKQKLIEGDIKSTFKLKQNAVTRSFDRKSLKSLLIIHEKSSSAAAPSPEAKRPKPPAEAKPGKTSTPYAFWQNAEVHAIRMEPGEGCKPPRHASLLDCAVQAEPNLKHCKIRLDKAANFPQTRFGKDGEPVETPGAIIYEGMQLVVLEDGRYELTFNASTPRIPVTMRLSLTVTVAPKKGSAASATEVTLTIPAIALVPPFRAAGEHGSYMPRSNNYQDNWRVRHQGYSPELGELIKAGSRISRLERSGTARLGSLPLAS